LEPARDSREKIGADSPVPKDLEGKSLACLEGIALIIFFS